MAYRDNIIDGNILSILSDITKKIQREGISSLECLIAFQNKKLPPSTMDVVMKIGIGCTKYLDTDGDTKSLIRNAKRFLYPTKESQEASAINHKLFTMNYGQTPFRPWHINKALSEEGVNVRKETLSKVLRARIIDNTLSKSKTSSPKGGKRSPKGEDAYCLSGPNWNYESSSFLQEIQTVLCIPEARKLIISQLLGSGVLARFVYFLLLEYLYTMAIKEQDDLKKLTRISTEIGNFPSGLLFDSQKTLDKVRLKEEAISLVERGLQKILDDDSIIVPAITKGGLHFAECNLESLRLKMN